MLMCLVLPGPMSLCELAGVPVILCFLLRTPHLWRTWPIVMVHTLILLALAFIAWLAISLSWSRDVPQGLVELGSLRWVWIPLVLYPVLDQRPKLIAALAVGFIVANAAQAWPGAARLIGADPLWYRAPGRFSGWWNPVVGGSLLVAALGLHLPAIFRGDAWLRRLAIAAAGVTLLGILATGSRGAWIAAAFLLLLALAIHAPILTRSRRLILAGAAVVLLIIASVLTVPPLRGAIAQRYAAAKDEISRAIEHRDFTTDTGARILMNAKALEAFAASPIIGVGAGGYKAWADDHLRTQGIDPATRSIHNHAHSTPLHLLATTGLVGAATFTAMIFIAFRGARWHARRASDNPYAAGPIYALTGLLLAGLFDSIHVNAQTSALLFLLLALAMAPYPTPRAIRSADPPSGTSRPPPG